MEWLLLQGHARHDAIRQPQNSTPSFQASKLPDEPKQTHNNTQPFPILRHHKRLICVYLWYRLHRWPEYDHPKHMCSQKSGNSPDPYATMPSVVMTPRFQFRGEEIPFAIRSAGYRIRQAGTEYSVHCVYGNCLTQLLARS